MRTCSRVFLLALPMLVRARSGRAPMRQAQMLFRSARPQCRAAAREFQYMTLR
jgi:hypothetical protein